MVAIDHLGSHSLQILNLACDDDAYIGSTD